MGEKLCDIYMKTYNLNIYSRLFNLYGPNHVQKHPSLISQIIKFINKNQKLKVYNFDNKVKRDYVFVKDVCDIIHKLMIRNYDIKNRIINVSSGECFSVPEIIDIIQKVSKSKLLFSVAKDKKQFWSNKYSSLFKGKYKMSEQVLKNEIFKSTYGNNLLARKILKRKFTCFEDGIKVCIESEIRHEK